MWQNPRWQSPPEAPGRPRSSPGRPYTRPMDTAPNLTPILGRYFQREWSHGEGHRLYDTSGKAYLDFANGIAVTALGHGHPKVNAAIHAQVDRIVGPINAVGFTEPVSRLASELAATFPDPLDSVLFLNSGSEAIDAALKLCRRVTGRPGIIAFRGGFHGRTFGATSITTSSLNYRTGYEPLLPGVHIAPFPVAYPDFDGDEEAASAAALAGLRALFEAEIPPTSVGSIVIEPVLGEGGYNPAPASFLQALRALCDEHGILLIADEVQTGHRPHREDVGRSSTPGSCPTSCAWPRQSRTDCRWRRSSRAARSRSVGARAPTARRSAGTRWRARPDWQSSR